MGSVDAILFLVILATVVATFARRLRVPAPRRQGAERSSWRVPAVVSWAGARGVVPLAAALSIPLTTSSGAALPGRDLVVLLTTAVIVITLVVQEFTLAPLVRRAGIAVAPDDVRQEHTTARLALAHAGLSHLEYLTETAAAPESVLHGLRTIWQNRIERIKEHKNGDPTRASSIYRRLRQDLLDVESAELDRLYHDGAISDATRRQIQRSLDLEHTGLGETPEAR